MKISGFGFRVLGRVVLAGCLFSFPCLAGSGVPTWQVLSDKSAIEWTATYGGKPVKGTFPAFTADIAFSADMLEGSRANIRIETAKVKSEDRDAQENLVTPDWFASAQYPLATFEVTHFKSAPCAPAMTCNASFGYFIAEGNLTVRDKTIPVTLPFSARFYDDKDASPPARYARIQGETIVKRTALGVGQGDWAQTDSVGDDVTIAVRLEAKQAP